MHAVEMSAGLRRRHVNRDGAPPLVGGQWPATQDLLLKHPNKIFAIYVWKQMKYLKHASIAIVTCATPYQLLNIQIKRLKQIFETPKTLETYACNIHILPLQHMQHLDKTLET
jgi:hypothetical protein